MMDWNWIPFAAKQLTFSWKVTGVVLFTVFVMVLLRYLVFSGAAYLIFWKWLRENLHYRRIQQRFPKWSSLQQEFLWSMSTFVIFGLIGVAIFWLDQFGYNQRYKRIQEYGWGYFFFSIVLMIIVHDAYFYWTHRAMHHKSVFRYFHRVHHQSFNPSPWAAFSFHPLEAFVQGSIGFVISLTIPHHGMAFLGFILFMTTMNVLGHLGYELFPKGFTTHPIGQWFNTSTHHNLHHHKGKQNYSLYFNWWDRWFGTNHEVYHSTYEEVTSRPKVTSSTTPGKLSAETSPSTRVL